MTFKEKFTKTFKLEQSLDKIDDICFKLGVDGEDFWVYFMKQKGYLSEFACIRDLMELFHWYLETLIDNKISQFGKKSGYWFYMEGDGIEIVNDNEDGTSLKDLPYKLKKELLSDKVFSYFVEVSGYDVSEMFSKKEERILKLEKLNEI